MLLKKLRVNHRSRGFYRICLARRAFLGYDDTTKEGAHLNTNQMGALIARLRKEKGMTQQELADRVGASQSAISHQLRLLKQAKLVKNRRQGKLVGYSLADDHVKTILGMAKEHLEEEP